MKTAMQEFFMVLKEFNKELYNTMYNEGILDTALKKEKEQIKKTVYDSMGANFDPNMGRAEMYYNDLYNQNK